MKLKDLEIGQKFMFLHDDYLQDIYEKKQALKDNWFLVGLPKVYDVFAVNGETEVIADDFDRKKK